MSVYVDEPIHAFGRTMLMCHMIADTADELHAMADRIGVDRRWYQGPGKASHPHYDVAKRKRAFAVQCGAVEMTRRELALKAREIRARIIAEPEFAATWGFDAALRGEV